MANLADFSYDASDKDSIIAYAQRFVGHSLRDSTEAGELANPKRRRGAFGDAVEEHVFGLTLNGESRPDFDEAGLELKCTPLKRLKNGSLAAKERLVLSMVDYMAVVDEDFEHSHLLGKIDDVLLVTYLWEKGEDPLDYVIQFAEEWSIPKEDMPQIRADWEKVVAKVRAGRAEDISGSDTLYLEACTKAKNNKVRRPQPYSDVPAKPRAWALKASYMSAIYSDIIDSQTIERMETEEGDDLLTIVERRFEPYYGMSQEELRSHFGVRKSKQECALITKHILGIEEDKKIAEFEKAGIKPKTIRLTRTGRPKEAISFPAFDYFDIEAQDFEDSTFREYLDQKYLFVLYRQDPEGVYRLADVCFWQMPDRDLEEAERCYETFRENVRRGRADLSVKMSENRCCHVRPHGKNASDTAPQPHGEPVVKKSFWLNQAYVGEEIKRTIED